MKQQNRNQRHRHRRRQLRRSGALAALALTAAVTAAGCTISPTSYWKEGPGHTYQCFLEFGPLTGHPTQPDAIFPIIGDLLYEACWINE